MGRKSLNIEGFGTFGTSVREVWFSSFNSRPVLKKCRTAWVTSSPTMCRDFWKKCKSFQAIIKKLCLATAVYFIWQERNKRYHEGSFRDANFVSQTIVDLIRCRLVSSKGVKDSEENRNLQLRWSLPDSIFSWAWVVVVLLVCNWLSCFLSFRVCLSFSFHFIKY